MVATANVQLISSRIRRAVNCSVAWILIFCRRFVKGMPQQFFRSA
jgi:hypothetical protein